MTNRRISHLSDLDPKIVPIAKGGTNIDTYTAGDILYASAADTLAKLAKGAANLHLVMNAAATFPEWAKDSQAGNTTRNIATASGNQAITGIGFKPSNVLIMAVVSGAGAWSVGLDDVTTTKCSIQSQSASVAGQIRADSNNSLWLQTGAADVAFGLLASLDTDGFTISWTKVGAPVGTAVLFYLCLR